MIVPRKMQYAMQDQNLDLLGGGVPQLPSVLGGNFGGDGDISGQSLEQARHRGERKHICHNVFAAEAGVEGPELPAACHQNVDYTL